LFSPFPCGSQPTMPGSAGTGDPDPGLRMQAKRGARRRERRDARASRSTDGGADKVRFGGAPYSKSAATHSFGNFQDRRVARPPVSGGEEDRILRPTLGRPPRQFPGEYMTAFQMVKSLDTSTAPTKSYGTERSSRGDRVRLARSSGNLLSCKCRW
jgi:hypothetical protein